MRHFLFLFLFSSLGFSQSEIGAEVKCPVCPKESCRWLIRANAEKTVRGKKITVSWDKSLVSNHVEKPFASPLHCNVDRSFNMANGGYVRVWFEGETEPCDATKVNNPAECGVEFLFGPAGPSEIFPSGFTAVAPVGKRLKKVEHKSTLFLYCGDFSSEKTMKSYSWDSVIGFDNALSGEGFYSDNPKPVVLPVTP